MKCQLLATNLFAFLAVASFVDAGFRCSVGEWSCVLSCKVQLKKTGICDSDGECRLIFFCVIFEIKYCIYQLNSKEYLEV